MGSALPSSEEAGPDAAKELSSSDSEEENQRPNFNILNNSLVEIYRNEREESGAHQTLADASACVEISCEDVESNAVQLCEQQAGDSCKSHDTVEPHPPPTHLASVAHTTNDVSLTLATPPLSEDHTSKQLQTKKVSFSSPEVTDQHDYVVVEESRMRRVKKRKSRRHDDVEESSKVKRKRSSEEESATASHLKAGKTSGESHVTWCVLELAPGLVCFKCCPLSFCITCLLHLQCYLCLEFTVQSSSVTFNDVGGASDCLREINKLVLHMRCSQLFEKLGVRPPQGFLLHGPPGCGKTLIAHAVAGVSRTKSR